MMGNYVVMDNPAIKKWGLPHIQTVPSPVEKLKARYWSFTTTTRDDSIGKSRNRQAAAWVEEQNREFWEQIE